MIKGIPEKFYKASHDPVTAYDIEELIELLQELPPDLRIEVGLSEGCVLSVFNIKTDPHLGIGDVSDIEDEEE